METIKYRVQYVSNKLNKKNIV